MASRSQSHRVSDEGPLLQKCALVLAFRAGIVSWAFVCDVNVERGREVLDLDRRTSARLVANMEDHLARDQSSCAVGCSAVEDDRRALNKPVDGDWA